MDCEFKNMKNLIICVLVFSFFFQSCHTYKEIDIKSTKLVVGKKYQIKQDTKFVKVKLEKVSDSTLTVLEQNTPKQIAVSEIKEIKVKKFSTSKTVWLSLGILTGLFLGVAVGASAAAYGS